MQPGEFELYKRNLFQSGNQVVLKIGSYLVSFVKVAKEQFTKHFSWDENTTDGLNWRDNLQ